MTMSEYAVMDLAWYEEARTAVLWYRQGQQARQSDDKARADIQAV